jgi:hypothetical protein
MQVRQAINDFIKAVSFKDTHVHFIILIQQAAYEKMKHLWLLEKFSTRISFPDRLLISKSMAVLFQDRQL